MRHLRYFVAVAELLHFGRAAAQLGIAQPSLSHQIRQLEDELQTTLLQRTKRRVRLTEAGRLFAEQAREILAHADRAAVIARRAHVGEVGRLRVGVADWMDVGNIVRTISRLHERQPATSVDLRTLSTPLQIAALQEERLDVGFVRPTGGEPFLASELLVTEPFIVALPKAHRLASATRLATAALADESHILVPRDALPIFYDLALKVCRDAGFVPHVRDEVEHPDLVLRLVASGVGVALVPAWARKLPRQGVVFRALHPSPSVLHTAVAWRRDNVSPILDGFLQVAREVASVTSAPLAARGPRALRASTI